MQAQPHRGLRLPSIADLVAVALAVGTIVLDLVDRPLLWQCCMEDGAVEWATALIYLCASILLLLGIRPRVRGSFWLYLLAAAFFFVGGEEISWGQRVLGIETPPAFLDANVQAEMNLHNLAGIHDKVRAISLLMVLGFCVANPIVRRFGIWPARLLDQLAVPDFPVSGIGSAVVAVLLMAIPRTIPDFDVDGGRIYNYDEVGELCLAVSFIVFVGAGARSRRASRQVGQPS